MSPLARRHGRRALACGAAALLLIAGGLWALRAPPLERFERAWALPAASAEATHPRVTVTFLGVATLVFRDGETTLLTDGWFSRVGAWDLLRRAPVAPDRAAIAAGLARAGVERAAAVIPVHSHYDHAQDAAEVARRTGALLLGSESTAWIGRGDGLPEAQIRIAEPGQPYPFGAFRVTLIPSRHVELPAGQGRLGETLDAPLTPPAPVDAYPEGTSWSILIEHPLGASLVQGSAGFVPGALAGRRADVVFLGLGMLGRRGADYTAEYLSEVVGAVGARRILPIHFDDLTRPAETRHRALPRIADDVIGSLERLQDHALAHPEISLGWLEPYREVVLFEGR